MKRKLISALLLLSMSAAASALEADASRLVRRYYLSITDRIPTESQTLAFLRNPDKESLVDSLLASDGFVKKQVVRWGDILRIKSEFPSCMWPNAVQAYNKWLTEEFRANTPYNEFVAKLIGPTGSNFRVPETNFYRAGSDRRPSKFSADVALLFLGQRTAPKDWESFFCQVRFKSTKEWKEEILCLDIDAVPEKSEIELGGKTIYLEEGTDFRQPLIKWLTSPDNRELARVEAARLWLWLMGEEIQDQARLEQLTDLLLNSGFNVRTLAREILLSEDFVSNFPTHRLTAEQICDALCDITEVYDKYSSRAPEPFTNFPNGTLAQDVSDGTITTSQLDIFGRPSRDVALESSRDNSVNAKQMLYLLNSADIHSKLRQSKVLAQIASKGNLRDAVKSLYLRVLSREASEAEIKAVEAWAAKTRNSTRQTVEATCWALLNTNEFLFLN